MGIFKREYRLFLREKIAKFHKMKKENVFLPKKKKSDIDNAPAGALYIERDRSKSRLLS